MDLDHDVEVYGSETYSSLKSGSEGTDVSVVPYPFEEGGSSGLPGRV